MPVTKTITLYSFDELSEEAQEKAIEKLWDLNVDYQWWEYTYEDAERAGICILEFDIDHNIIKGRLNDCLLDSVKHIIDNHGHTCNTYAIATRYVNDYMKAFREWRAKQDESDVVHWGEEAWLNEFESEDNADEIANDYRKEMLEEYLLILRKEYEYQTSEKAIVETIQGNEYLFTENGELA